MLTAVPSLWPWPWIQYSNLFTRHSSLWTRLVAKKISSSEHIIESHFSVWTQTQCDLDLEDSNAFFFAHTTLSYNDISPCRHKICLYSIMNTFKEISATANLPIAVSQMAAMKMSRFVPQKTDITRNNDAFTHCGISHISPNTLHQTYSRS